MKRNDFTFVKGLGIPELAQKAKDLKQELANLVLDKNMKKLKDLKVLSKKRKERAQILTVIKQKQLLEELEAKKGKQS